MLSLRESWICDTHMTAPSLCPSGRKLSLAEGGEARLKSR